MAEDGAETGTGAGWAGPVGIQSHSHSNNPTDASAGNSGSVKSPAESGHDGRTTLFRRPTNPNPNPNPNPNLNANLYAHPNLGLNPSGIPRSPDPNLNPAQTLTHLIGEAKSVGPSALFRGKSRDGRGRGGPSPNPNPNPNPNQNSTLAYAAKVPPSRRQLSIQAVLVDPPPSAPASRSTPPSSIDRYSDVESSLSSYSGSRSAYSGSRYRR